MDNKVLKALIAILVLFVLPVVSGVIIVKLFVTGKGITLMIIFISLIILSVALSVYRFIKYKRDKE